MSYLKFQSYFCHLLFGAVLVFGCAYNTFSQNQNSACTAKEFESYVQLDAERSKAQKEAAEQESRIKVLKDKILQLESLEKELAETNQEIKTLEEKTPKTATEKIPKIDQDNLPLQGLKYIDKPSIEGKIAGLNEGKPTSQLKEELSQNEQTYPAKIARLQCIDNVLRKWLSPEGNFKFWVSVIFAVLIGAVIIGFFWTAITDENVRRAVFAGQVGLQFIALFSIVIAIILFGITGILEARELAALLGSLAGYILGRTTANLSNDGKTPQTTTGNLGDNANGVKQPDAQLPDPQQPQLNDVEKNALLLDEENKPIEQPAIANIAVAPASINLTSAAPTQMLSVTAMDVQNNSVSNLPSVRFEWKSDNNAVATVDQTGLITWVGIGNCIVTATANANAVVSNNCEVICT